MAVVQIPWSVPPPQVGADDVGFGFLFDDVAQTLLGIYGWNLGVDTLYFEATLLSGRTFRQPLPPDTPYTERIIPAAQRLVTVEVTKTRRRGVLLPEPITKRVLPLASWGSEREYANPLRNSPVVLSVTETVWTSGTTKNANLPATVNANDGLWYTVGAANNDGISPINSLIPGSPAGYTTPASNGSWVDDDGALAYGAARTGIKVADGSEDGGTINVSTGVSGAGACYVKRIQAGTWAEDVSALEATAEFYQATANPNPPAITPSWGSQDPVWETFIVVENDIGGTPTVPSGYTSGGFEDINSTLDAGFAIAYRTNPAASEDPGTWTLPASNDVVSWTLALADTLGGGGGGGGLTPWLLDTPEVDLVYQHRALPLVSLDSGTDYDDTGLAITVTSTIASVDQADFEAPRALTIASTLAVVTQTDFESPLAMTIASTMNAVNQADFKQLNRAFVITSTLAIVDQRSHSEFNKPITIASTLAAVSQADFKQLNRTFTIASTLATVTQADFKEARALTIASTLSVLDGMSYVESRAITIASTLAAVSQADFKQLNRAFVIASALSAVTQADFELVLALQGATTVACISQLDAESALQLSITSVLAAITQADFDALWALLINSTLAGSDTHTSAAGNTEDLDMTATVTLALVSVASYVEARQLTVSSVLAGVTQGDFEESRNLTISSVLAGASQVDFESPVSLVVSSSLVATSQADFEDPHSLVGMTTIGGNDDGNLVSVAGFLVTSTWTETDQADFELELELEIVSTLVGLDDAIEPFGADLFEGFEYEMEIHPAGLTLDIEDMVWAMDLVVVTLELEVEIVSYKIKEGSTMPALEFTVKRNGAVVDLTAAVDVFVRGRHDNGVDHLNVEADVIDAPNGVCRYEWEPGDLVVGDLAIDALVNWGGGETEIFPNDGYAKIEVLEGAQ